MKCLAFGPASVSLLSGKKHPAKSKYSIDIFKASQLLIKERKFGLSPKASACFFNRAGSKVFSD